MFKKILVNKEFLIKIILSKTIVAGKKIEGKIGSMKFLGTTGWRSGCQLSTTLVDSISDIL